MDVPHTITNESVTVIHKGETYTVKAGDPNFEKVRDLARAKKWDDIPPLLTKGLAIEQWAKGQFRFEKGELYYENEVLPSEIYNRIFKMSEAGEDPRPIMRFWKRLQNNPSWRSVQQLWRFLENHNIPIGKDGCILAYKSVRQNYYDHRSGTVKYEIGSTVRAPRNRVSDDPQVACHYGLHIGAKGYAASFGSGGRLLIMKVDPADVVCIPHDNNYQKMRTCRLVVLGHYGVDLPDTVWEDEILEGITGDEEIDKQLELPLAQMPKKIENKGHEKVLEEKTLEELRDMAVEMGIKGASHVLGGKKALIKLIVREQGVHVDPPKPEVQDERFLRLDSFDIRELEAFSIDVLRKYAAKHLKIVGASKIPGGKAALAAKIIEVRKK